MNFLLALCNNAPGNNPASHKIWNPLQTPKTKPPPVSMCDDALHAIGENLAMAPLLEVIAVRKSSR